MFRIKSTFEADESLSNRIHTQYFRFHFKYFTNINSFKLCSSLWAKYWGNLHLKEEKMYKQRATVAWSRSYTGRDLKQDNVTPRVILWGSLRQVYTRSFGLVNLLQIGCRGIRLIVIKSVETEYSSQKFPWTRSACKSYAGLWSLHSHGTKTQNTLFPLSPVAPQVEEIAGPR